MKTGHLLLATALLCTALVIADPNGARIWNPYFAKCLGLGRTKKQSLDGSTSDFIKKGPGARLELEDCAFDETAGNQLFAITSQLKDLKAEDTGELIHARVYWLSTKDHGCVGFDDTTGGESLLYSYQPQRCSTSNSTFLFFTSGHKTQGVQLAQAQLKPRCLAARADPVLGIKVSLLECVAEEDGQFWQFCNYQLNDCTGTVKPTGSEGG